MAETEEHRAPQQGATVNLHPILKKARAVLFDAGGTLVHPDWRRLVSLVAEQTGRSLTDIELQRVLRETLRDADAGLQRGVSPPEYMRRQGWVFRQTYTALGLDEKMCDLVHKRADELHAERHLWCELDPDAPPVLAALKEAGLKIAVISNTEDGRLEELLELVEIAHHFDLLVDSHAVGHRKPEAQIFRLALERLGVEPEEAVYVGDLYGHDVRGAESVGMRAVLIDPFHLHQDKECTRIAALAELIGQSFTALTFD